MKKNNQGLVQLCFCIRVQVRNMANKTGLDFSDQLFTLESNYQQV